MKFLLIWLALLVPLTANAAVLNNCVTLDSAATVTATANGTIYVLNETDRLKEIKHFTGILSVTNNSGTTPTLDVTIQTCESKVTTSCVDTAIVFTQCTTGTCSERVDLNLTNNNVFSHFRVKYTAGGTSPNYTSTIRICHE